MVGSDQMRQMAMTAKRSGARRTNAAPPCDGRAGHRLGRGASGHSASPCRRMSRRLMIISGSTATNRIDRERGSATIVAVLEHLQEHLVGHDVGVETPAGHDIDDVEDLQDGDGDGDGDHDDRALDGRHDDPEEQLTLRGTVQLGRLGDLAWARP